MSSTSHLQSAAIVCSEVADSSASILYAERSEPEDEADSGWQFLCGATTEDWQMAKVWALHEVLTREPSLARFIELPVGSVLTRKSPLDEWEVRHSH